MMAAILRQIEAALETQLSEHDRHGTPIDITAIRTAKRRIGAQAEMVEEGLYE